MNLKTATLTALIVTATYTLLGVLGFLTFFISPLRDILYSLHNGPVGQIMEIAFPASIALFFFALYSKQNKP